MKIRKTFVTNSSSSSFVVYGVCANQIDGIVTTNNWGDETLNSEVYEKMRGTYLSGGGQYEQKIGITPIKIEKSFPDIKVSEIREIVANEINKVFGTNFTKENIDFFEEGWYDG